MNEPYLTVAVDPSGSVRWQVVADDQIAWATSGVRALAVMEAMRRARGLPLPQATDQPS